MATLSPRQKEAIYLKFVSELSYEELAKVMQLNYQSARNLVSQTSGQLSEKLPLYSVSIRPVSGFLKIVETSR